MAMTLYGDPALRLTEMSQPSRVSHSGDQARSWQTTLRNHAVLRTAASAASFHALSHTVPDAVSKIAINLAEQGFVDPPALSQDTLEEMDQQSLTTQACTDAERLSLHAVIIAARAHMYGVDANPLCIPEPGEAVRRLFRELNDVVGIAGRLFDMRLNGLAFMLLGRLLIAAQNVPQTGMQETIAFRIRLGVEKFEECKELSPFVTRLYEEGKNMLRSYGS
jgi:hypothetical protein